MSFYDELKNKLLEKRSMLTTFATKRNMMILFLFVVMISVCYFLYKNYVVPKIEPSFVPNKEFVPRDYSDSAVMMFFYTDWCPHCKKAKPIWNKIKEEYDGKIINNTQLAFKSINCETEEEMANKYNIEGYPTIKLQMGNKIIEYDAKPEESSLVEFIETSLA
jgi:thiol-disulfide isomerase/thioredoxin